MTSSTESRPSGLPGGPVHGLPVPSDANLHFWQGGREGRLQFLRCGACGWWLHPPMPVCPQCLSRDLTVQAVPGRGTVYSYTVNHQPWYAGQEVPYVVALVALPEQAGLRLMTNVVGCPVEDVHIAMAVTVEFVEIEDVFVPLFRPDPGSANDAAPAAEGTPS